MFFKMYDTISTKPNKILQISMIVMVCMYDVESEFTMHDFQSQLIGYLMLYKLLYELLLL